MSEADVTAWLTKSNLATLADRFREHSVDGVSLAIMCEMFTKMEMPAMLAWLKEELGVTQVGVALRFVHKLRALCFPDVALA
jgi:hypothetical protein